MLYESFNLKWLIYVYEKYAIVNALDLRTVVTLFLEKPMFVYIGLKNQSFNNGELESIFL